MLLLSVDRSAEEVCPWIHAGGINVVVFRVFAHGVDICEGLCCGEDDGSTEGEIEINRNGGGGGASVEEVGVD